MRSSGAHACLIPLFTIWAGILIGVSFIATPAKFGAPSLSMAVALDVGRHTFRVLGFVEFGIAAAASLLCWIAKPKAGVVSGLGALWLILIVEWAWLLPTLDQRVSSFLLGSPPAVSYHHTLFIGLEALKVAILLACAAYGAFHRSGRWW
jgi:hypothetical protein